MKKKRLLAVLLAATMTIGCLTGCGSKQTAADDKETVDSTDATEEADAEEETEGEYPFEVVDLEGYTFTVADNNMGRWFPEEGSSEVANAIIDRVNKVQELFNCTIEVKNYDETEFANAVTAGEDYADIVVCETWNLGRHIKAKRIVDLAELDGLNLDADYWTKYNNTNLLTYQGKVYGVAAPFASQSDEIFLMFFNKNIIDELGLESPYDLYAKNEWTFSKFLEYCKAAKKDLNGDGVFDENDRYGFTCGHNWDTPVVMYLASGNQFYSENPDGSIEFQLNTPNAFKAVNQIKEMLNPIDTFWPKPEGAEMEAYAQAFAEGKSLFYTYTRGRNVAQTVYDMEDDFGIVPIPRGDDADTYRCWVSHDAPSVSIPTTNQNKDKTVKIMEALAYFAQDENELELDEFCDTKLRDDESADILREIPQYAHSDLAFIGQQCAGGFYAALNSVVDVTFNAREKEIASTVAGIEVEVETGIQEFIDIMLGKTAEE
ncbi:MAG: extracellular solute-binding protein [Acetatifactor sp.]|nr:extracellular solute-binding protein [Acetatifactor sp.]